MAKKEILKNNNKARLIKIIGSLILLEFFLFYMPRDFLYSNSRPIAITFALISIFVAIPYCISVILDDCFYAKNAVTLGIATILINGPLFGFYHLHREEKDLALNGQIAIGKVIQKKFMDTKRGDYWTIKAEYKVKDKRYITGFEKPNDAENYQIGDDVKIIYLENYPRVFRVK